MIYMIASFANINRNILPIGPFQYGARANFARLFIVNFLHPITIDGLLGFTIVRSNII